MGWGSGSELAEDVWSIVRRHIPLASRKVVARKLVEVFEQHDCDTMEEAESLWKAADVKVDNEDEA